MALTRKIAVFTPASNPENRSNLLVFAAKQHHLVYLDGLRGIVALYVVIFHSFFFQREVAPGVLPVENTFVNRLYQALHLADYIFQYGHQAVVIFIVLSGYSLMLQPVYSKSKQLSGGVSGYLKRRAMRVLPAYYAALLLSLLLIVLVPGMNQPSAQTGNNIVWHNSELPAFTPQTILFHLLLIHNWFKETHVAINSPLWSIGLEWQLYFLMAFGFLPLWRKLGTWALFWVGIFIAFGAHFITSQKLFYAYPGFIGIFALGMAGAALSFSPEIVERKWRQCLNWKRLAMIGGAVLALLRALEITNYLNLPLAGQVWPRLGKIDWFQDSVVAVVTVSLLIHYSPAHPVSTGTEPWLIRVLKSKQLTGLGKFSYSLYLIHAPVLVIIGLICAAFKLNPALAALIVLVVGVPLAVLVAYLFHLVFERPFLKRK